ncbi:hypothetical protein LTR62_008208 [Meristemomyces frigidus]|uniref:C2H2-type domain-containing protein n=1 Tax=Meristemomyces frigidus TaxID=1508187 RepID=A0AAN7TDS9_9PEZI|nr:hypothetical protein LTR62_008208 [Meristemomyces frigidus]
MTQPSKTLALNYLITPASNQYHHHHHHHHQKKPQQTPSARSTYNRQLANAAISDAIAQLQNTCMNNFATGPRSRGQQYTPTSATPATSFNTAAAAVSSDAYNSRGWSGYQSMGDLSAAVHSLQQSSIRGRSHQRTPSDSTVASNGPLSPYTQHDSNPTIFNPDFAPQQFFNETGTFAKHLPPATLNGDWVSTSYAPSIAAQSGGAHDAMKDFAIDHHNGDGFASDSLGHTMSSRGRNSPATPPMTASETAQNGQYAPVQNGEDRRQSLAETTNTDMDGDSDYQPNPNVQLWRTDSQAYQDELYNPPTTTYTQPQTASKAPSGFLSPHRNLMTERLQTANLARSQSPTSSVSRERSPFRDHSPLAPVRGWQAPGQAVGTASGLRQQQKEQAEETELAQHRPQLLREPTKTISPKDAMLEYNEPEQPSLFQDTIPAGYKHHNGGTEQWPSNYLSQTAAAYGSLQAPPNFRATTSADGLSGPDPLAFQPLPPTTEQSQSHNNTYLTASYPAVTKMESNPEFPAHLTTMESSISDNGPLPSSQDSAVNVAAAPQRPSDTRAGTGSYTCTYHGCIQRFDSAVNLQKHKRDAHRSQVQHNRDTSAASAPSDEATSPATHDDDGSASPRGSSGSPAPSASGMTSAALLARNSQAGPHKCTRINPSTNKPCNTIFSRPYDLTRHEDTIHNGRKQKVRCPMCREEKTFSRNDALTRHMRVVHPEVENFGKRKRSIV